MKRTNMATKPAATPADKGFAASMNTMMKGMNVKPTGKPDKDFVLMMMPHHQGAIDMAKVEFGNTGTDPKENCASWRPISSPHRKGNRANEGLAREKQQVSLSARRARPLTLLTNANRVALARGEPRSGAIRHERGYRAHL